MVALVLSEQVEQRVFPLVRSRRMESEENVVCTLEESIKRVVCIEDSQTSPETAVAAELENPTASKLGSCEILEAETVVTKVVTVVEPSNNAEDANAGDSNPEVDAEDGSKAEADTTGDAGDAGDAGAASDSDSEDDLQLIVNDEDFFYPHGVEPAEEGETEELYAVPGEEQYDEMNWPADMHYHPSQYKYVRPGAAGASGATQSPGVQPDGGQPPPAIGAMGPMPFAPYMMNQWAFQPYEFILPPSKTVFDIDLDQFEEKPWEYPGADITDYFNFDFTEETWKQYCEDLARLESETPVKNRHRGYENGHQGYGDRDGYRSRSRGSRGQLSGRAIQVEGGSLERRPSGDMRRQRGRDSGSTIQISVDDDDDHDGFRRRRRNDEPYPPRRRDFSRQHFSGEKPSGSRRGEFGRGNDMYPGGRSRYPGRQSQGPSNDGFGSGGRPYDRRNRSSENRRNMSDDHMDRDDNNGGSYGSSESRDSYQNDLSEDEYHGRRRMIGRRPPREVTEVEDSDRDKDVRQTMASWRTERTERRIISSGHQQREPSFEKPRSEVEEGPAADRRSQRLTERRRSWQVLSENRLGRLPAEDEDASADAPETPVERRRSLSFTERRSGQASAEGRSQSERKPDRQSEFTPASAEPMPIPAPAPFVKRQTRAELIAERRKAQVIARQKLEEEKSLEAAAAAAAAAATVETSVEVKTKVLTVKKAETTQVQPRFKRQENTGKEDLRMKVLETVSARWKMQLRMDDAHSRRKRDKVVADRTEGPVESGPREPEPVSEQVEDGPVEEEYDARRSRKRKEKREERKQRHRERTEVEDREYYEPEPVDDRDEERWHEQEAEVEAETGYHSSRSHRKSKKRRRESEEEYYRYEDEMEEDEVGEFRRSRSRSRRRHRDEDGMYDGNVVENDVEAANEYVEEEWEGDRWDAYEEERSTKRRKYYKDEEASDIRDGDYGGYTHTEGYAMSTEEDVYYKSRDRRRYDDAPAGRWTGSLHESDEDEY